jgi:tripartite-type tricarboxylate transporter receptor subunit TctC
MDRRSFHRGLVGGLAAAGLVTAPREAQAAFPERVITIVVPFAPGGATDLAGRLMAERIGGLLSGRAIVENKPGAGSALGAEHVRRSAPDGYTLLLGSASTLAVAPASGSASARYDPVNDFTPLALVGISTMGLVVSADSGIRTTAELIERMRANRDGAGFASSGVGGVTHLAGEYFAKVAGVPATHIPYRGGTQVPEAIIKGEVLYAIDTLGSIIGQIRGGLLRLLAVSTRTRDPNFPDVPTIAEAALPDFELASWTALVGPAGLPAEVSSALGSAAARALNEPTVRSRLESTGTIPELNSTPEGTRAFIERQFALYRAVVQRIGLRLD